MTDPAKEILELIHFLSQEQRPDVKAIALQQIQGLTGSKDGLELIKKCAINNCSLEVTNLFQHLSTITAGTDQVLAKDAALALINLSSDKELASLALTNGDFDKALDKSIVPELWSVLEDPNSSIADPVCMIFCNISTHDSQTCGQVFKSLSGQRTFSIDRIITIFAKEGYNKKGANMHYLAPFISNLSQLSDVREQLMDKNNPVALSRLLAFTQYPGSRVRRGGVIGALRNCCFETSFHDWLLSEVNGIDILPRLLLPLAGPTPEDMDPDEVDKLPIDLQYLGDEKEVEGDPDLRKMLLESLLQLCATRSGRESLRSKNTYHILKELHKVETEPDVKLACENVVDLLIKKEGSGEITVDNLHEVDVPCEMVPELEKMDEEYLK